jgi:chemotaxis protein methyltransferase CheR
MMAQELGETLNRVPSSASKGNAAKRDKDDIATYGEDYVRFCRRVKKLTAIDLESYKGQQMHRRLESYRLRHGVPDFASLANGVERDPGKLKALVDYLTINVSEFFRNPDQWQILQERILPDMLKDPSAGGIRAWSAGSSCGQEAYSLAMLLCEMGADCSAILGTDIDEPSLKRAEAAVYTEEEVATVSRHLLAKYLVSDGSGYRVCDKLRRMVGFRRRDLLSDAYPSGMDLILCRNVLIYFTEKGKNQVIAGLVKSLKPRGVLFTGATEAIFNPSLLGLNQIQPFFYHRASNGRR